MGTAKAWCPNMRRADERVTLARRASLASDHLQANARNDMRRDEFVVTNTNVGMHRHQSR